jgi:hypothetical protein
MRNIEKHNNCNSMELSSSSEVASLSATQNFPTFYRTPMFITVFTKTTQ